MDASYTYEIRVEGRLPERWSGWFEGLAVRLEGNETVLTGPLPDQAALHGLLRKIHDLNLVLVSVKRSSDNVMVS